MRVGLTLPQYDVDFEASRVDAAAALAYATAADACGLDSVWLSDHAFAVAPDGAVSGALDPRGLLAAAAARTEHVEVGSLVLGASMWTPAQVVSTARSWLAVGGRRVTCGLGAGWNPRTHRAFGIDLAPYGARVAHLGTCLAALEEHLPRVRLLVGGWGPPVLALAARHAHTWNLAWDVPAGAYRSVAGALDSACVAAGRDPATLARSVGLTVLAGSTRSHLARSVAHVAARAPFLSGLTLEDLEGRIVAGTPEQCAERIASYGADEVVLAPFVRDDLDLLATLAGEVAPRLR